jgi:hypothetical protein
MRNIEREFVRLGAATANLTRRSCGRATSADGNLIPPIERASVRPGAATVNLTRRSCGSATGADGRSIPSIERTFRAARRRYRASHKEELRERRRLKRLTDHAYRERQLTRERQWQRKKRFKVVYGISLEDYDVMLEQQNGACAICGRKPNERLAVDHCHATGTVRGLLCAKCNSGLAFYQDNPERLLAAIAYLEASSGDETAQLAGADKATDAAPPASGVADEPATIRSEDARSSTTGPVTSPGSPVAPD